ncbi:MAG: biotin-dependent carboxyltransferase family protein, partial [Clostridia bacterium]
ALEITLLGPRLEFGKKTVIAVTGAPVKVFLNRNEIPMWQNVEVNPGDVLSFSYVQGGVHAYVCISGGINVPEVMGSKSTYTQSSLGGFEGRKLQPGDVIDSGEPLPGVSKQVGKRIPEEFLPCFEKEIDVRVALGLASYRISDEGIRAFLNGNWKVSPESNRVAYRFHGPTLDFEPFETPFGAGSGFSNVVDTAYPLGGILLTNSQEIIIQLSDATTGGGFMTFGAVISADLNLIAQSRPSTLVRFSAVTVNQAYQARQENKMKLVKVADQLK